MEGHGRLRRAVALHRLVSAPEAAAALKEPSPEGRFCRLLATGVAEPPPASPQGRRDRLLIAPVLFRAARAAEAEAVLSGLDLEAPDVEDKSDPKKVLRFHDPLLATAWERTCWERAVVALRPLAIGGTGAEKRLAAYYAGLGLHHLGVPEESTKLLKLADDASLGAELQPAARLLIAAASWKDQGSVAELGPLWEATQSQPDSVLLWEELRRSDLATSEPFATRLETRLRELLPPSPERPSGALVGRWGLARLRRGDDAAGLLAVLSEHQDKSNKNKLEWNDPLLLLALSAANYRDQEYAQALETLFELSKTLPGCGPSMEHAGRLCRAAEGRWRGPDQPGAASQGKRRVCRVKRAIVVGIVVGILVSVPPWGIAGSQRRFPTGKPVHTASTAGRPRSTSSRATTWSGSASRSCSSTAS
jgi:hypothetical protein